MSQVVAKRKRRQARQDPRYKGGRKGKTGAEAKARKIARAMNKAVREGRSYGYSKK